VESRPNPELSLVAVALLTCGISVRAAQEAQVVDLEPGRPVRNAGAQPDAFTGNLVEPQEPGMPVENGGAGSTSTCPASGRWKLWTLSSCNSVIASAVPRTELPAQCPSRLQRRPRRQS
jgi:hypothetical protein